MVIGPQQVLRRYCLLMIGLAKTTASASGGRLRLVMCAEGG